MLSVAGPFHTINLGLTGYRHDPRIVDKMAGHLALLWIHRVFALMKQWGLGTSWPSSKARGQLSQ
jgi:hypothetical protein